MIFRVCYHLSSLFLFFILVEDVVKSATSDGADCGPEPPFTRIEFENYTKFKVSSNCNHSSNYQLKFKCMSEWCKGNTTKEVNLTSSYFYKEGSGSFNLPDDILEFTEYLPEIFDSQNTLLKNYSIIKTNPGKPKQVQDLSVYCDVGHEVGIKWKPPYPPTGDISQYYLKWNGTCYNKSRISLPSTDCGFFGNSDHCFYIIPRVMHNSTCHNTVLHVQAGVKGHNGLGDNASTVIPDSVHGNDTTLLGDLKMGLINSSNLSLTWEHSFYDDCTPKQIKIYMNNVPMGNFSLEENIKKIEVSLPRNISKFVLKVTIQKFNDTNQAVIAEGNLTRITQLYSESLNDYISIFCKNSNCVIKIPKKFKVDNESGEYFLPWDSNGRQISYEQILKICRNKEQNDMLAQFRENGEYLEAVVKGPILERNIIEVLHNEYLISPVQGDGSSYMKKNLSLYIAFIPTTTTRAFSRSSLRPTIKQTTAPPTMMMLLSISIVLIIIIIICLAIILISSFCFHTEERRKFPNCLTLLFCLDNNTTALSYNPVQSDGEEMVVLNKSHSYSETINIKVLEKYLKEKIGLLETQFNTICDLPSDNLTTNKGQKFENLSKNRYGKIMPYDYNIVTLKNRDNRSSYINASYIKGYQNPRAFIATQAPMENTVQNFWWMIWQESVPTIVMLANLKEGFREQCFKYWPELQKSMICGPIQVENVTFRKQFGDYNLRKFVLYYENQKRYVDHYHFTSWPDHSIPHHAETVGDFLTTLMDILKPYPMVIHCNAGCGRTGTLILSHIALEMALNEDQVDFMQILSSLRRQRMRQVSNKDQYILAHLIVLHCLFTQKFCIPVDLYFQKRIAEILENPKQSIKTLMNSVEAKLAIEAKFIPSTSLNLSDDDKSKNRYSKILPDKRFQMFLNGGYINAIRIDFGPRKFIVTQQPLPNTLKDFWSVVDKLEVDTIISLNELNEKDSGCPVFWQTKKILEDIDCGTYSKLSIKTSTTNETKIVNIIDLKIWKCKTTIPADVETLVEIWTNFVNHSGKGNLVVTCFDGCTASGLFVALNILLNKINLEGKCDVYSAVKIARHYRRQFLVDESQLEFLYKTAAKYVQNLKTQIFFK